MSEARNRPPPLLVERYLLDVLTPAEQAELARLCSPEELSRLRAEHVALARDLLARKPAAEFARRVEAEHARQRQVRRPALGSMVAFAALLALLAFVSKRALESSDRGSAATSARQELQDRGERAKGLRPTLRVYRKRGDMPELLAYGASARRGDVLQLGYLAPGMTHAILLSIDGRAEVTLHFPHDPAASSQIPHGQGEQLLPSAYELDEAPAFERFVLLVAARPLRATDALRAAQQLAQRGTAAARDAALPLPGYVEQTSVLVSKPAP